MTRAHSEDCDCGCHDEFGPEIYPPYAVLGIAGFILVAISMLVSGIVYLLAFAHDGNVAWDPSVGTVCIYIYYITAICLLVISAYGLYRGIYSESMFFIIYAVFTFMMAYAQNDIGVTDDAMRMVDITMGIILLLPTLVFLLNREGLLALGVLAYVIGLFGSEIVGLASSDSSLLVYGIGSIVAGVVFAYLATANVVYAETGHDLPLF